MGAFGNSIHSLYAISAGMEISVKITILAAAIIISLSAFRSAVLNGIFSNNTLFFTGIAVSLFVYGLFFNKLKKMRWLTISIISMFISFIAFTAFLFVYGNRQTATYDEEFVIVLGAGVRQGRIMPVLRRRLEAALRYHERNPYAIIIVSGGQGYREPYPESYIMARFLIEAGVPADQILIEASSTSTFTNMLYSRDVLEMYIEPGSNPTIAVITNDFHMFRSMSFASRMGFNARSYPAPTPFTTKWGAYPREIAATIKMWIIGT